MVCWFRTDDAVLVQALVSVTNKGSGTNTFAILADGDSVGDPVWMHTRYNLGSANVRTTTGYSVNTWHHAAGVWASTTDRRVFIDGGSKDTSSLEIIPTGIDRTVIGRLGDSSPGLYFSGRIAETGIWNVALTDVEVAVLAGGVSPLRVRPGRLKGYWPIFGASPETDLSGQGNNLTVTGTTVADHAPVAPQFGFGGTELSPAAAAVAAFDTPVLGASMVGILGG